jgi:demethylmenaquinone methyltransferase/2-methoxy-6-polyprenyl-1,4-benzoquinol methylase
MFDGLVPRYDLVNDILSLGLDRWWRRSVARVIADAVGPRTTVLDLGCGTGKLGLLLAGRARVVGLDVSPAMLEAARSRSAGRLRLVQGSAFRLPFADGAFDAVTSGFVLRNLDSLPRAFAEVHRVTARGGTLAALDITEPQNPMLRRLFDAYFSGVAPLLGELVGKRDEYSYLVRSLAQLPEPVEVLRLLEATGFVGCTARPLTGGTVTLFTATKPSEPIGRVRG